MSAMFSQYERGLEQLLRRIRPDQALYVEALTLQVRLQENMSATRLYGDTETRRAERAGILHELNRLALTTFGTSFASFSQSLIERGLAPDVREQAVTYLAKDFEQTSMMPAAGLSGVTLREVLSIDGLFLAPVWRWYQADVVNKADIVDLLVEQMAKEETARYLLLGQAGQGKTTVMKKVYGSLIARYRDGASEAIPVYFPLREGRFLPAFSLAGLWEYLAHRPQNPLPLDYSCQPSGHRRMK